VNRPDAAAIRSLSKVDFAALGFTDDTELQQVVDQALSYIEWVTARTYDATMPPPLAPVALQAARMRTEQIAFQAQEDYAETAADDVVSSMSVGSYSETRTDPNRRGEKRSLNSWPALTELLWLLLGTSAVYPNDLVDAQRDYWNSLLNGVNAPAGFVSEIMWSPEMYAGEAGLGYEGGGYNYVPQSFPIWPN
jgi:hypothetical protein